ncbi:MAG: aminoacyl-tRNA hydrolase [Candidatus Aminicenantes bacterium]|nr:aminoacyl-tRNA hydrolase [Candidatus Aminicenantes bacterium]
MINIKGDLFIRKREIKFKFIRSSGPGGQNVNKVSTGVQLKFDVNGSPNLSEETKIKLIKTGGKRITNDGVIIIEAKRFRDQEKNRKDAIHRLVEMIRKALIKPKNRVKTKKTFSSDFVRLESKKKHGEQKQTRKKVTSWEE